MTGANDAIRAAGDRLDILLRELDAHADAAVRDGVREMVALLMELHRHGLERALQLAADPALAGPAFINRLADDPLVGPLLLVHDLHPYSLEVRLARALDRLRPELAMRGCRATLASIEGESARVRLEGGTARPDRLELMRRVEIGLLEAAPELTTIVVDAPEAETPAPPLIQILRHPPAAVPMSVKP